MCEKTLFKALDKNYTDLTRLQGSYYLVAKDIQMKMKLLDTKIITGAVYIERAKNLRKDYYEVIEGGGKEMKITYKKKQKVILGKEVGIDFEQMLKERRPQGINTGF